MKSFQFPLQRALDWRAVQMRTEEEKLAALQRQLAALIHREKVLMAAQLKSQLGLFSQPCISGSELRALAAFQARIRRERAAVNTERGPCEARIAAQRTRLLKARKDYRVLEKLKQKRWKSWVYLNDREAEHTAAEAYISQWGRSAIEGAKT